MSIFTQLRSILAKGPEEAKPETPEAPAAPVERRRRKRTSTHKGRRILIIDDSPTIVAALRKILRSAGCVTFEAGDAESGLDILRAEKPDFVFLDIVLPGMNGFAALRLMRKDDSTRDIPVIMISGNEQATEQFYVKRIGADDFMKKPFSRHEVFARIENLIATNKLRNLFADESISSVFASRPAAPTVPASVPPTHTTAAVSTSVPPTTPVAGAAAGPDGVQHSVGAAAAASTQPITASVAPARPIASTATAVGGTTADRSPAHNGGASQNSAAALEARKYLTAMGLQYYNQAQFNAAIERGDKLAVELFIAGGGVNVKL